LRPHCRPPPTQSAALLSLGPVINLTHPLPRGEKKQSVSRRRAPLTVRYLYRSLPAPLAPPCHPSLRPRLHRPRLLPAPAPPQDAAIREIMSGRDVVVTARTGSGKTLAYLLPALHAVLTAPDPGAAWQVVVLVPTRELCDQVRAESAAVGRWLGAGVTTVSLAPPTASTAPPAPGPGGAAAAAAAAAARDEAQLRTLCSSGAQIVVATPARLAAALALPGAVSTMPEPACMGRGARLPPLPSLHSLRLLCLDEADLLLSLGHRASLSAVAAAAPSGCQVVLMSATRGDEGGVGEETGEGEGGGGEGASSDDGDDDGDGDRRGGTSGAAAALAAGGLALRDPVDLDLTGPAYAGIAGSLGASVAAANAALALADPSADPANTAARAAAATIRARGPLAGVSDTVEHYALPCRADDTNDPMAGRLLSTMCLLRLGRVRRKVLLFVNAVDRGYRLKLYLERFGVRAALLNAALPAASRRRALEQFHKGMFDHLIATDVGDGGAGGASGSGRQADGTASTASAGTAAPGEFGLVRGIDFRDVGTVISVDPPRTLVDYAHRVGRTGRAGRSGQAILLVPDAAAAAGAGTAANTARAERALADEVDAALGGSGSGPPPPTIAPGVDAAPVSSVAAVGLRPWPRLPAAVVDGLRYRGDSVARSLSDRAVREARVRDLRRELLGSERLRGHFEENPRDRAVLRGDRPLGSSASGGEGGGEGKRATRALPSYLKRGTGAGAAGRPRGEGPGAGGRPGGRRGGGKRAAGLATADPLRAAGGVRSAKPQPQPPAKAKGFMRSTARDDDGATAVEASIARRAKTEFNKRVKKGLEPRPAGWKGGRDRPPRGPRKGGR